MPDDHWLSWQAEQAGTNHAPSIGAVLALLTVVTVLLLALLSPSTGTAPSRPATPPPCAQHWPPTCERAR